MRLSDAIVKAALEGRLHVSVSLALDKMEADCNLRDPVTIMIMKALDNLYSDLKEVNEALGAEQVVLRSQR